MSDRDTHFAGFAKLCYPELARYFRMLHTAQLERDTHRIEQMERLIQQIMAERAYDLVHHATDFLDLWETHQALDHAYDWEYLFELIPDLTTWPESEK